MEHQLKNPFVTEGFVSKDYFCDRETELADMLQALDSGRNLTLYSPRRMGKTGLILRAFAECQDITCYYMDIMNTTCLKDFVNQLASEIIGSMDRPLDKLLNTITNISKRLRPVINVDTLTGTPSVTLNLERGQEEHTLKDIFEYLKQSGKRCYIAIDEFQQIAFYPETNVEALLRSYIQFIPNCSFIFAGSKKHLMIEMFSSPKRPFYQSTQPLSLKPIERDKYYQFATQWFHQAGSELSEECFFHIYDTVYGHTWYIQYWLSKLFDMAGATVTMQDVNQCLDKILIESEDEYLTYIQLLTSSQIQVITAIAKEGKALQPFATHFLTKYPLPALSTVRSSLNRLVEDDIVLYDMDEYSIYNRFFMLWLKRR